MATVFSDNFNRTNSNSLGANWTEGEASATDLAISSNKVVALGGGAAWFDSNMAVYSGAAGNDCKVSFEEYWVEAAGEDIYAVARGSVGGDSYLESGYYLQNKNSDNTLKLWDEGPDGTWTQLGSNVAITIALETWYNSKITVQGTTIKGYFEGVEKISVTDASHSSGSAGFMVAVDNSYTYWIDDFLIEDFAAGGLSIPVAMRTYRNRRVS